MLVTFWGGFARPTRRGAHLWRRRRGGQLRGRFLGVGKVVRGTPRVEEHNPSSIFRTLGVVMAWGECNHIEGRTTKDVRVLERVGVS